MSRYEEIDLRSIKVHSVVDRVSKVEERMLASPQEAGGRMRDFLSGLPRVLAARDLLELAGHISEARERGKPVLMMMGAHVIKVGVSPVIVDLIERGILRGIAMNGAGVIHDVELAYFGKTSEDVASSLEDGSFGMGRETAEIVNGSVKAALDEKLGFGEAVGKRILEDHPERMETSILARAYAREIPVTVHVALGTDIVHQHPSAEGAAIGEASMRDFRIWCRLVSGIGDGGVVLLLGSSVLLPEVFLKSLSVARNVSGRPEGFITANFDMIRHYRSTVNFVERPVRGGGKGYNFVGHHEIMIPLLSAAVKESLDSGRA